MNIKTLFLTASLLYFNTSWSQNKFDTYNYESIDSFVKTVQYQNDIVKLSQELTQPYTENIYKIRAIFKWITENIEYDYKFINKGKEIKKPNCENVIDCSQKIEEWKTAYIKKVLERKKGVCSGYAEVFKKLCDLNNIPCEIINGYVKSKPYEVGNNMSVNHAWNAVMIDSIWYYLDATWAAGGCNEDEETGKLLGYHKEYQNYYWLTPYKKLVRNHYPENGKWVEKPAITKNTFFNKPFYYNTSILENIDVEAQDSGIIWTKKGDTIHFRFNYKIPIYKIQINSNNFKNPPLWYKDEKSKKMIRDTLADKKQVYIDFIKDNDTYKFNYPIKENSIYYIDLVFDYNKAIRYKIKIVE